MKKLLQPLHRSSDFLYPFADNFRMRAVALSSFPIGFLTVCVKSSVCLLHYSENAV